MAQRNQDQTKRDQTKSHPQNDPKAPDNAHDSHATEGEESTDQTPVPKGAPGDPTRETWERIHQNKVQTTKEEMPSPKRPM